MEGDVQHNLFLSFESDVDLNQVKHLVEQNANELQLSSTNLTGMYVNLIVLKF